MNSEPSRLYQELAATLARLDDATGLAALEELLAHPDPDARRRALGALVQLRRRQGLSVVELVRRGLLDSIAEVRESALELYRGETELLPDVARLVSDRAQAVRRLASSAVRDARSRNPEALAPVFSLLADPTADVRNRVRAVQALAYPCGCDEHRQALEGALVDDSEAVRTNAARVLDAVAPDPVLSERLRARFGGVEGDVRVSVTWGLAALGDADNYSLFVDALEEVELRRPAVNGLGRLGYPSALGPLRRLWEELGEPGALIAG